MKTGRPTLRAGLHNRLACRATVPHGRELDYRTPANDAPSVRHPSLTAGNLSRVSLFHARDAAFSFTRSSGLALLNFVAARVEPGSQSRRDSAELRPCVDRRLRHGEHDGARDVRQVEQVYPKPGEVCRERG